MDTSGFCQVGRYGTLCLLKRHVHSAESANDNVVTSFGIDDEELTFGSSTTCGVRLYYSDVESLHCKIVFDEYKVCRYFLSLLVNVYLLPGFSCCLGCVWRGCGWM